MIATYVAYDDYLMVTVIIVIANADRNARVMGNGRLETRGRTRYRGCRRGASTGC